VRRFNEKFLISRGEPFHDVIIPGPIDFGYGQRVGQDRTRTRTIVPVKCQA
jgi:hypothetical protein